MSHFPHLLFKIADNRKKNFICFFQNERMQIIWPVIVHACLFQPTTNIKNGNVSISQLLLHLQRQTFFLIFQIKKTFVYFFFYQR